jgi:tripartite-type tricarboxylate transporter receptor subunit TctC
LIAKHAGAETDKARRKEISMISRRLVTVAAFALVLSVPTERSVAQDYPAKPVRMIVPFAPGGPTDVCARLIAQRLSESTGQRFYVENITGAGGNIGTGQAAKAQPDGYTVLIAVNSHVMNPILYERVPYDPYRDFDPVTMAVTFGSVLAVNPSVPAATVKELVTLIRAGSVKYSFGSPGVGTPSHLVGEQFRLSLGLDLVHVPYGGGGPAIASVVAGHTPIAFAALSAAAPQARERKLRVLALMSKSRSDLLPEVPAIAEAGYQDLDGDGWVGILVPAGTPKEIVAKLHREVAGIIAIPEIRTRLAALGFSPAGTAPEEFAIQMKLEAGKWAKVIRAAGIKPE